MKKLSVQDVDRCVNDKQNSDSGKVGKPPSPHVERNLAASEADDGQAGLLPCPFCGNEAQPRRTSVSSLGEEFDARWVECGICEIGTKYHDSVKTAARTWNARVHQPPEQNLEDKNSVSPKPKALSHSSVVVSGDSSESAAQPEYRIACFHSMFKPDCLGCWQGHVERLNYQLRKLEASIALPIKERVEAIILENVTNWFQVWKSVPRDTEGWIKNAAHYLSWGINRDLPMTDQPSTSDVLGNPDRGTSYRDKSKSSESESTLATVDKAAQRAAEKIDDMFDIAIQGGRLYSEGWTRGRVKGKLAEIIATELSVHQPDVQVVDEVSKEQDNAEGK